MPNQLNIPAVRTHIRRLADGKLRALHATANDPVELARIAKEEGRTPEESRTIVDLVNREYARRFPVEVKGRFRGLTPNAK